MYYLSFSVYTYVLRMYQMFIIRRREYGKVIVQEYLNHKIPMEQKFFPGFCCLAHSEYFKNVYSNFFHQSL